MNFSNIPHMQRQKLIILERVRLDIGRFTNPVFNLFFHRGGDLSALLCQAHALFDIW